MDDPRKVEEKQFWGGISNTGCKEKGNPLSLGHAQLFLYPGTLVKAATVMIVRWGGVEGQGEVHPDPVC